MAKDKKTKYHKVKDEMPQTTRVPHAFLRVAFFKWLHGQHNNEKIFS